MKLTVLFCFTSLAFASVPCGIRPSSDQNEISGRFRRFVSLKSVLQSVHLSYLILIQKKQTRNLKIQSQILGGDMAPTGKWPWQVLLVATEHSSDDSDDASILWKCGGEGLMWLEVGFSLGTIISNRWILTAAHCL